MNKTLPKVYAAIVGIPLAGILFASAIASDSKPYDYDAYERDLKTMQQEGLARGGAVKSEADAYKSLGKYNPCIFIACEGE